MPSVPRESSPGAPAAAACHPEVPSSVLAPTATAAASSTWSSRKGTAPAAPAPPTHTRRVSTGTGARRQSSNSADGRAPARRRCLLLSLADLRPLMPAAELRRETRTLKCHLCPAPLVRAPIRSAVRLLAGDTHALQRIWPSFGLETNHTRLLTWSSSTLIWGAQIRSILRWRYGRRTRRTSERRS